jgi:cytochrome oxidase Cu insertion factor (SCO1/SenC/PrrC family)
MIRHSAAALVAISVVVSMGEPLWAQRGENPRQRVVSQFEASGLKEGSAFPDVQIYDAQGNPFRTGKLKGGYTVLVTGCLT